MFGSIAGSGPLFVLLLILLVPGAAQGQQPAEDARASDAIALAVRRAPLFSLEPADSAAAEPVMAAVAASVSRHFLVGAASGAVVGGAFALAVVALADCGGPGCTGERVVGVAAHALAGAAVGALLGGVVYLFRR